MTYRWGRDEGLIVVDEIEEEIIVDYLMDGDTLELLQGVSVGRAGDFWVDHKFRVGHDGMAVSPDLVRVQKHGHTRSGIVVPDEALACKPNWLIKGHATADAKIDLKPGARKMLERVETQISDGVVFLFWEDDMVIAGGAGWDGLDVDQDGVIKVGEEELDLGPFGDRSCVHVVHVGLVVVDEDCYFVSHAGCPGVAVKSSFFGILFVPVRDAWGLWFGEGGVLK